MAGEYHMKEIWKTGHASFMAVLLTFAAAMASGCVPPASRQEAQKETAPAEDPFAAAVGRLAPGSTTVMATPYGPDSAVRAGEDYISGLGLTCRRVLVLSRGQEHRLAVCRDRGSWQTFNPIFENTRR